MPSWTIDQKKAIDKRGGKIIVSAAAGSGKTAVLSERVIKLILEGTSVSELLIVTFTKAAAEEMRTRIKDKINEAYLKDKSNERLKRELKLVSLAKITTMDAFYQDVVKENFSQLKINKNFNILSNEEEKVLKEKCIKNTLEEAFDNYEDYDKVLDMFNVSSTSLIKNIVLKISSFLDTVPFPDQFIEKMISNYDKKNTFYMDLLLKQIRNKMSSYDALYSEFIETLYNESEDFDKVLELARKERNYVTDILTINDLDGLAQRLRTIEFDTLRTPKGHKDDDVMIRYKVIREDLKKDVRKTYAELKYINNEMFFKEQEKIGRMLKTLFLVVLDYRNSLLKEKKSLNAFSFSDIAHFVIELLIKDGKKTNLAKNLSKRYKEILIDEYQDTNNLQNVIFNAVSKDDENLFLVGDVKQSIYRFRSACPEIFNEDKKLASPDGFPNLITLSKNFRSRKEVLDFCNFVFENTMCDFFGEVSYDKDEKLYLGASFSEGKNLDTEVLLIDGMEKNEDDSDELTKVQKEAIVVADRIQNLLSSNYQVFDNKKGSFRCIKPSDIVILLRSLKDGDVFMDALKKRNISVYLESALEYFDNYEVKLIINLLKIIDNLFDDVSLMSVLNSFLVDVSLDDIVSLRSKFKKESLYESLKCSDNHTLNDFFKALENLKNYAKTNTLSDLLSKIYNDFNVLEVLPAMPGGTLRYKNLMQMINHASAFDEKAKNSLHDFIIYLESVILNKGSLEGVNPLSDGDNVLITTIHKSKGLEYPIVILSETGKNFNFKDVRSDVMINDTLGFVCNIRDNDYNVKYESVPIMVFKEYEKSKMLSEELRILYVALTRAKEKIIISGFTPNLTNMVTKVSSKIGDKRIVSKLYLNGVKNYLDILMACLLRHPSLRQLRSLSMVIPKTFVTEAKVKVNVYDASKIDEKEFLLTDLKPKEKFDYDWYKKIMSYKNKAEPYLPAYLSVSEIKENKNFVKRPRFMDEKEKGTNLGTLYHFALEALPIKRYDIKSLQEELENLVSNKIIRKEDKSKLRLENLFAFFKSDLYDEILLSDKVYKEFQIDFEIPASYYDKTLKSGNILTSGIIDLLFVKDGVYYILDYKTDNVLNLKELKNRYKIQLDLYELAVKEKMNAKNVKKFIYSIKLNEFIEV